MKNQTDFGMKGMIWGPLHGGKCYNCKNIISQGATYYYDRTGDTDYCQTCGETLRYHRKKATQRGELMPMTHEESEKRIQILMDERKK